MQFKVPVDTHKLNTAKASLVEDRLSPAVSAHSIRAERIGMLQAAYIKQYHLIVVKWVCSLLQCLPSRTALSYRFTQPQPNSPLKVLWKHASLPSRFRLKWVVSCERFMGFERLLVPLRWPYCLIFYTIVFNYFRLPRVVDELGRLRTVINLQANKYVNWQGAGGEEISPELFLSEKGYKT